ncbi:MAG: cytochrome c1 [Burkholderiales bacterium]|nr:cytochrome c1 [Burkholderiales bacterium]
MISKIVTNVARAMVCAALLAPLAVLAAADGAKLHQAPVNLNDLVSLQRGAHVFVNYCLNCHSASYMRYNRLRDLGLSDDQIRDNLIFTGVKVGEPMKVALSTREAGQLFNIPTPDITVITRSRSSEAGSGSDWLYSYFRAFYRDSVRPTGWNNLVYENSSMPHVLWQFSGQHQVEVQEFDSHAAAKAALLQVKSVARLDEISGKDKDGREVKRWLLKTIRPGSAGTLPPLEYDRLVADLVNYMTYMAEPARLERTQIGIYVLLLLGVLFVFAYLLKKEYWKDVQ